MTSPLSMNLGYTSLASLIKQNLYRAIDIADTALTERYLIQLHQLGESIDLLALYRYAQQRQHKISISYFAQLLCVTENL